MLLVGAYCLKRLASSRKRSLPLPPGPRPLPIIGNLLDVPSESPWLTFAEWKHRFGPVSSVSILGQRTVILNTLASSTAFFDKRGAAYSDRPQPTMACELVGYKDRLMIFLNYDAQFKHFRTLIRPVMGSRAAVAQYGRELEREARRFVRDAMTLENEEDSRELEVLIRRTAGSIILKITYGYEVQGANDRLVKVVEEAMSHFAHVTTPGAFLVDSIPFLKYIPEWIPGMSFKRTAKHYAQSFTKMIEYPYRTVKERMATEDAPPSYVSNLLSERPDIDVSEENDIKLSAMALYAGGADTTVSAVHSFFLAMTLHPSIQRKAQEEVDAIVGADRLPTFEDLEHLSYVDAVCKEVLRWLPVVPLKESIPHISTADDVYEGMIIPKGTQLIANLWEMLHDEETYPDPHTFNPERFFGSGADGNPQLDPRTICFGFGRRICPGLHLAYPSMMLEAATALATLNIGRATDKDKNEIVPEVNILPGTICHPIPFKCKVTARSEEARDLVQEI
ncbi:cytochrome P450 [Coniophora puteana RWD-64-598 SS2]|uniref:Cytochrome P450 n=1 Tax=Coniophora puteana (strain RWD-64-598) TaxID=741705 RepID=A0A5M3MH76_CONPW|nr:cytochrome P450 [Coniophora puteana RWD-64-598 SS2]EIW77985.1 cytochrome P450 [Coniophora puteana RWD-64-598 SS2]